MNIHRTLTNNRRLALVTAVATALAAQAAFGDNDSYGDEPCTTGEACTTLDLPIVHPLQGTALADGRVPVLDVKNSPDGRRYAVDEGQIAAEDTPISRRSGVIGLEQRRPDTPELQQMYTEKLDSNGGLEAEPGDGKSPKISSSLRAAVQQSRPGAMHSVQLRVQEPNAPSAFEDLERAIARGEVSTRGEAYDKRQQLLAARQVRVAEAQAPVVAAIEAAGGVLVSRFDNLYGLNAKLNLNQIKLISRLQAVERMDLAAELVDHIDGQDVIVGTQVAQFVNNGYDGENGSDTDISFAVIENQKLHDDHNGFVDSSSATSSPRIRVRYDCTSSNCSSVSNYSGPGSHATSVNGIVFGDLRDGQDSAITDTLERKEKSGYAGEARGYVYAVNYSSNALREALDDVINRTYTPHVVNMSLGVSEDLDCEGDTALSKDANDLFEEGLLPVVAAGNTPGSSTNCTVSSPGSAIGVYTVGGQGNTSFGGDADDVEYAAIYSSSAMGGVSSSQGVNRTIIDSTAYACRDDLFDTSGGYSGSGCGTSYAAPTVAAAAINHVDFYKNNISDLVDNPGILFSNLLVMGDREGQSGKISREFDSLWGAGRTTMRKLDSAGMDAPYGWGTGYTCVDDGQTVSITINQGNTLSADVDYLKAVIYWFDPRHQKGKSVSDIDLRLKTTSGSTLKSSLDYYDNKERVFERNVGGQAVKLEINGWDVKTDTTSCGSNSMKVFYTWFYEDGDRDDADGPGNKVDPE